MRQSIAHFCRRIVVSFRTADVLDLFERVQGVEHHSFSANVAREIGREGSG